MRSNLTSLPLRRLSLAISVVICQALLTCPVANAAEDNTSAAATDSTSGDPARLGEISVTGQLAAIRRAQAIKQDAVGVVRPRCEKTRRT